LDYNVYYKTPTQNIEMFNKKKQITFQTFS